MLILSEADVADVLSMRDAIDAVEGALRAQADGRVQQPLRVVTRSSAGFLGAMPCAIEGVGVGAKLVTFYPGNAGSSVHTHQAVIALFEPETGVPTALIDGRLITEMRTAATSAVATRVLASRSDGVVAVLGTGVQARSHVQALREAGSLRSVRVWGRTPEHAESFARWASAQGVAASPARTVADACRGAAVVCTVTPAREPILDAADVEPGCHINAVGSSAPHLRELSSALLARARLVVDTVEGAMSEAGEIVAAVAEGVLPAAPDMVRLCDVVAGKAVGRRSPDEVTVFKSLGMALEDVACATIAVGRANQRGLGKVVEL